MILKKNRFFIKTGALFFMSTWMGCSLIATRPIQIMSDTSAAIRAAKEVQADTLASEYFRQANEWFLKAKKEYRYKNFYLASQYAEKAKIFAEKAEFESIRVGGNSNEKEQESKTRRIDGSDESSQSDSETSETSETKDRENQAKKRDPAGISVEQYEAREAAGAQEKEKAKLETEKKETPQQPAEGDNSNLFRPFSLPKNK